MSEPNGVKPSPKFGGRPVEHEGDSPTPMSEDEVRRLARLIDEARPKPFNLIAHLHAQRAWSLQTFGPGAIDESLAYNAYCDADVAPGEQRLDAWAAAILAVFDGAMRAGHEPNVPRRS